MKQSSNQQIKVQMAEECQLSIRQYPNSGQVKIELDEDAFPPVRRYPITIKPCPLEGHQFIIINSQNRMNVFVQTLRSVLCDVLSPEEAHRFIDDYEAFRNRRIYVLIAIAFAKWRSFKELEYFESVLTSELQIRGIPLFSFLPHDPLARTLRACQYYLNDFLDKAVQELYSGLQQTIVAKAFRFIKGLEEQLRVNKTLKPDFDSDDNISESLRLLHPLQQQSYQRGTAGYAQHEHLKAMNAGAARQQEIYYEEQIRATKINQQPFLISVRDDPNQQLLFRTDPSLKLNGKFSDWLGK